MKLPMLAGKAPADLAALSYPVWGSRKYDGIRATSWGGVLYSRSLKPIPNKEVQRIYAGLPDGVDGELIHGNPTSKEVFQRSTSACMGHDYHHGGQLRFYTFDLANEQPFETRLALLDRAIRGHDGIIKVEQTLLKSITELVTYTDESVELGYEGTMLRGAGSPNKAGRSTTKEGYLLKIKNFEDAEAVVVGQTFKQHNTNIAVRGATGHMERSSKKAGIVETELLGSLVVKGLNGSFKGVEFEIGTGFTLEQRVEWGQMNLKGKVCKYKYQSVGAKDRPRFPVFLGWRKD